jgi:hypothetical protein
LMRILIYNWLPMRGTQTGINVARRDVLTSTLPRMLERRFAFDLELLLVVIHYGYGRTVEPPAQIQVRISTSISIGATYHMLLDTASKFYSARIRRHYSIRSNRTGYVIAVTPSQLRQS